MFDERFIRRDSGLLCDLTSAADALELRALVDLGGLLPACCCMLCCFAVACLLLACCCCLNWGF
jgi:hypothetical protein